MVSTLNHKLTPGRMEKGGGSSETVKGDSYTVREIMVRFANGLSAGAQREGIYRENSTHDDEDLEKANNLDLFEKEMLAADYAELVKTLKGKAKEEEEAKKKNRDEKIAAERARLLEELGQQQQQQKPIQNINQ